MISYNNTGYIDRYPIIFLVDVRNVCWREVEKAPLVVVCPRLLCHHHYCVQQWPQCSVGSVGAVQTSDTFLSVLFGSSPPPVCRVSPQPTPVLYDQHRGTLVPNYYGPVITIIIITSLFAEML